LVEEDNLAAAWFLMSQVGMQKVDAVFDNIRSLNGSDLIVFPRHFEPTDKIETPIVVMGVDSIPARQMIFDVAMSSEPVKWIIDVRTGWDQVIVYSFPIEDNQRFVESFNKRVEPLPCGAKAVAYNAFWAASIVGGLVKSISIGDEVPRFQSWCFKTWSVIREFAS